MEKNHYDKAAVAGDMPHNTVAHHDIHSRRPPEGRTTFSQVFMIAVAFVLGLQGLKYIAPWYDYLRLKGTMQASVDQAQVMTDDAVIRAVMAKARQLQLPLDLSDVHLERSTYSGTRLWATYEVTLSFPLGLSHTETYRPDVRSAR